MTDDSAFAGSPAWSPDGTTIAFSRNSAIYAMNADGTNVHALTNGAAYADAPAWSADGTQVAFSQNQQIWTMARDGSNQRQLTAGDSNGSPAWQPLGPPPPGCTLWGTAGNDLLVGTEGNDVICGLGGDDTLIGLGHDHLYGGDRNDYLAGGLGYDSSTAGLATTRSTPATKPDLVTGDGHDTASWTPAGHDDGHRTAARRPHPRSGARRRRTRRADEPAGSAVDSRIDDWWNSGYPSHWIGSTCSGLSTSPTSAWSRQSSRPARRCSFSAGRAQTTRSVCCTSSAARRSTSSSSTSRRSIPGTTCATCASRSRSRKHRCPGSRGARSRCTAPP